MLLKVILGALFASVAFAASTSFETILASVDIAAGASFQIHPNANNPKCLDVKGNSLANGTAVQIFDCNGTGAQKWIINAKKTKVQLAGTSFCLDAGSVPADNVPMKIWKCLDDLPAQAWFYTADLRIPLTWSRQCLDLTNGNITNGNPVQTFRCTLLNSNQVWTTTTSPTSQALD